MRARLKLLTVSATRDVQRAIARPSSRDWRSSRHLASASWGAEHVAESADGKNPGRHQRRLHRIAVHVPSVRTYVGNRCSRLHILDVSLCRSAERRGSLSAMSVEPARELTDAPFREAPTARRSIRNHNNFLISVLSRTGKEAVVAMLGPGDFFGEGALTGSS